MQIDHCDKHWAMRIQFHQACECIIIIITSRYPVEYPRSFVLGGKKIFRNGEGKGIRGERGKNWATEGEKKKKKKKKEKKCGKGKKLPTVWKKKKGSNVI